MSPWYHVGQGRLGRRTRTILEHADKVEVFRLDEEKGPQPEFDPGVGFRVWKDDQAVEILICFGCNNLYCGPPTNRARENAAFGSSPRRSYLVRLAKEAFPDDKAIQRLK